MNAMPGGPQENVYEFPQAVEVEHSFVTKVYAWMCFALIVTGIVAFAMAQSGYAVEIMRRGLFFPLLIAEVVVVLGISWGLNRISAGVATAGFVLYSVLNGLTISVILLFYTQASVAQTFFITAGTFGAMSAYGYYTKRDLTTIGNIAYMALLGLIIASVVNIFMRNEAMYWVISYAGVIIFVGLTAYDTQKIKNDYVVHAQHGEAEWLGKAAIMGALTLYLDFINMFMFLLSFMGNRE